MSSKIFSAALLGIEAYLVEVEAALGGGEFGQISIVGLPDTSVSEAKERVRSAIINSQLNFPKRKITINLAPAKLKKVGPIYDLPIALSILALNYKLNLDLKNSLFVGELSLSGHLRPITSTIALALLLKNKNLKNIFLPKENAFEASLVKNINIFPLRHLSDIFLSPQTLLSRNKEKTYFSKISPKYIDKKDHSNNGLQNNYLDFADIRGQKQAKRALKIALAGAHNILLLGPPGCGKTTLAQASLGVLPDLNEFERLEVAKILSFQEKNLHTLNNLQLIKRPFRAPHHQSSTAALIGGGRKFSLGELSLAHLGILFLDEFAEFPRNIIELLRQPLETGLINLARADFNLQLPARFILIAAMNPCPCGLSGVENKTCLCSPTKIRNYQNKISQAILDRIDLHLNVLPLKQAELTSDNSNEPSLLIKQQIEKARSKQKKRNQVQQKDLYLNSYLNIDQIKKYCALDANSQKLIELANQKLQLSVRSYFKIIKIARTIADLEAKDRINSSHLAEALQYRSPLF